MKRVISHPYTLSTLLVGLVAVSIMLGFRLKNVNHAPADRKDASGVMNKHDIREENKIQELRVYDNWTQFTTQDGLPSNKVNAVRVDGDQVWIGTDKGLSLLKNDKIVKTYRVEDGLVHQNVVSVDVSPLTGDVWIGTMGGLNRFSAGKFETYNQFNSGMPNDVVYQVFCIDKYVWVATGGGAGAYDVFSNEWMIYTQNNAPMHEPWTYGISGGDGKVYIAAWGGGIIEYELATGKMRDYHDPDGEMEIDLFPDDGLIHDITTGSSYSNGILWVGTYFGMSRYDGVRWKGYFDHDSGLASNFINFTKAQGSVVWLCTDNGLSNFNGETWVTYRPVPNSKKGEVIVTEGEKKKTLSTGTTLANNFVWGMDYDEEHIWIATAKGLSKGSSSGNLMAKMTY